MAETSRRRQASADPPRLLGVPTVARSKTDPLDDCHLALQPLAANSGFVWR